MKRKTFTPVPGEVYKNSGGGNYRCIASGGIFQPGEARMQNISSLWTFTANGCAVYDDGTIDWDHSVGGYFAESPLGTGTSFADYKYALESVGPALKERILAEAGADPNITAMELKQLAEFAYADSM